MPLAPGRGSTTTACLTDSLMPWAIMRDTESPARPPENGKITRIGLLG